MTPPEDAHIAVGKDCDCGYPLVWRHGQQWCAVYGSHPAPVHYRNRPTSNPHAEAGARLVALMTNHTWPRRRGAA